ncbi:MAG: PhnD/SsuA/transferrin family substrate-binding protein [Jaaginema sp. PMC 1079.18]|nr:PhnD/SsuA/transferrin family substrate-binding protein [Jaaginema sp. PMC 1080.18]MEC4849839.1 PhnD/SsuA/transferrin family substrate-binding protein [Jaaginema sp. PMC 1079.18]MEC4864552.1 PhnD/SsuA/transferrin family substrate-binding protein [Jaaginema sp. PMC 1078.18]
MQRRSFLFYAALFVAGCSAGKVSDNASKTEIIPAKIRLAITDAINAELLAQYEPFRQELARLVGSEVEFFPVESYTAAAIALQKSDVDIALTGPAEYVAIRSRTNAVPIVALSRPNYYSVIIKTAENSEVKSLTDLKTKTISMGSVGSTSSYLGPTYLLVQAGLNPKTDLKVENLDEAGLEALVAGEVAAWCGSWTDYQAFLNNQNLTEADLPILAKSQLLPGDVFVSSSQLDPDAIAQLSEIMLNAEADLLSALANVDEGKYQKSNFAPAKDEDYNLIQEAYEAVGESNFI